MLLATHPRPTSSFVRHPLRRWQRHPLLASCPQGPRPRPCRWRVCHPLLHRRAATKAHTAHGPTACGAGAEQVTCSGPGHVSWLQLQELASINTLRCAGRQSLVTFASLSVAHLRIEILRDNRVSQTTVDLFFRLSEDFDVSVGRLRQSRLLRLGWFIKLRQI